MALGGEGDLGQPARLPGPRRSNGQRTARRRRITRSVRAQLAVKLAGGEVRLQEVYLGQDKLSSGAWGTLKGHTTWSDAMSANNVGKDAP